MADQVQSLIAKGTEITGFDPRKMSKNSLRILIIGSILGYVLWNFHGDIVLMLEDSVEILKLGLFVILGSAVLAAVWKHIGTFTDMLSRTFLSWMIDYDPWSLQYKQIDEVEKRFEKSMQAKEILIAKDSELTDKLKDNEQKRMESSEAAKLGRKNLEKKAFDTEKGRIQMEQVVADLEQEAVDCQLYTERVGPLVGQIKEILKIQESTSIVIKHQIARSRSSLKKLRDTYDTTEVAANALNDMKSAMIGDKVLNDQAEQSKMKILRDISLNNGKIMTSIDIIGELTLQSNLNDAAKVTVAKKKLLELGISSDESIPIDYYQKNALPGRATSNDSKVMQFPD